LVFLDAAPIAAPIAAAPIAAAATTVFEGFCVEEAGFEADALALEDVGAADFAVVVGFALTLPEDLAGAGADATFFAGVGDAFEACVFAAGAFADFTGAAVRFAGADLAAGFAADFEAGFEAGFAAVFLTGAFTEDLEALALFAGVDFFAAGFAGPLAELLAGAFAAVFDAGFFVCFAIVRLIILSYLPGILA
jgi:hypothetical protein